MFLKLSGRRCLVVGAGNIAESKVTSLVAAEATVTVIAPDARPEVQKLAQMGKIMWHARAFQESDLDGIFLVVSGTNSASVDRAVYTAAKARGILCNAVDDPPYCDFYFPSVVQRGDLQIAISTAGESPALAQRLRKEIDAHLPQDAGRWLADLGQLRREVLAAEPQSEDRKSLLHQLARRDVCGAADCPSRVMARQHAEKLAAAARKEIA